MYLFTKKPFRKVLRGKKFKPVHTQKNVDLPMAAGEHPSSSGSEAERPFPGDLLQSWMFPILFEFKSGLLAPSGFLNKCSVVCVVGEW